jgi:hypothetical protein
MPVTVDALAQRVLRRLGLSLVAGSDRPTSTATTTKARMASQALRRLGVTVVDTADRASGSGSRTLADMGAGVLRHLGVMPVPASQTPTTSGAVTAAEVAARALRIVGVNPAGPGTVTGTVAASALATRTLMRLGVIDESEAPSAAAQASAVQTVGDVHQRLVAAGIATWGPDEVPRYMAQIYEILAANLAAQAFGRTSTRENYASALQEAHATALTGGRGQALAEAKVAEVHGSLARRGIADWPLDVIPAAVAGDLAVLVAAHLAPIYSADIKLDPAAAEQRILMAMMLGARGQAEAQNALRSVHDALADMGVADWTVDATPHSVANDMIAAAAAMLGPMLGRPEAPDLYSAALARIRTSVQGRRAQVQAEEEVERAHASLVAAGLANWSIDQTPSAYADGIVGIVVARLAPVYGGKFDPASVDAAMTAARRLLLAGPLGVALAAEKVRAVHANLASRRKTRWLLTDIPTAAEEPYVMMAATLMAPEAGLQPDPNAWAGGEMQITKMNAIPATGEPMRVDYF